MTATQFLWDVAGSLPVLLKDGSTAYVYGPGGLPVEQVNTSATYWFHHDQLGSTRLLTDSTGTSQATYTYDPFGGLASSTGSITNPFLYCGEYKDSESGLYFLRARYFEPSTGQFISHDAAVSATRSPYGYVANNPLNASDPSGLACAFIICSGGLGVGGVAGAGVGIAGAQATLNGNVGVFAGGQGGAHLGGTLSGAAFAYAGPYHACAPNANDNGNVGAAAGAGANVWFSNATSASQLRGNFHAVDVTAGWKIGGSVNIQWDDHGTWIVSVTPPIPGNGLTFGGLVSKYTSNTFAWGDWHWPWSH
jgi:RHS repeat-associated protein